MRILIIFLSWIWISLFTLSSYAQVKVVSPNFMTLQVQGQKMKFHYYRNFSLDAPHPKAVRAVVVMHGALRNADEYYQRLLNAATKAGISEKDSSVLMIAPQFLTEDDVSEHRLGADVLCWTPGGWKQGDQSLNSMAQASSFTVIDSILIRIARTCPQLKSLVMPGHSAGGQFVNRYAASNRTEQILRSRYGLKIRYIVANPSSYVYFNEERRVTGTTTKFALPTPAEIQQCPNYNDYRYGLDGINPYLTKTGVPQIRKQYPLREVIYMLGTADNDPTHPSLDKSCPALLEGKHRLERGKIYYNYVKHYFGPAVHNIQKKFLIPGVGHSSAQMFASECGVGYIFDFGPCAPKPGPLLSKMAEKAAIQPDAAFLEPNMPNPFNPSTNIRFRLLKAGQVSIRIYDANGGLIKTITEGTSWEAGSHTLLWDGRNNQGQAVSSGIYFYQMIAGNTVQTRQMSLLK